MPSTWGAIPFLASYYYPKQNHANNFYSSYRWRDSTLKHSFSSRLFENAQGLVDPKIKEQKLIKGWLIEEIM